MIDHRSPWPNPLDVEVANLEYMHCFNHERIHTAVGDRPPVEHEDACWHPPQHQTAGTQ